MQDYNTETDKITAVATAMINGEMSLIEGCRIISSLRHTANSPNDDIFNVFVGVDSETDGYPLGKVREGFNPEYLRRLDDDIEQYLEGERSSIIRSCQELIERFSKVK